MNAGASSRDWLVEKAEAGYRGYPVGTIAFYGPDDRRATKIAVGVVLADNASPMAMQKWFCRDADVRSDATILGEAVDFLKRYAVQSLAMAESIFGCPHEEGIDYQGKVCPHCPFWADRDRFAQSRARVLAESARQQPNEGKLP